VYLRTLDTCVIKCNSLAITIFNQQINYRQIYKHVLRLFQAWARLVHFLNCLRVSSYSVSLQKFCTLLMFVINLMCRFRGPHGLRRRPAAARLLRLWFRILPGAWMSVVCVVFCQVEVCATSWSLAQRSPTDCVASLSVIYKTSWMSRPWPTGGRGAVASNEKKALCALSFTNPLYCTFLKHLVEVKIL